MGDSLTVLSRSPFLGSSLESKNPILSQNFNIASDEKGGVGGDIA